MKIMKRNILATILAILLAMGLTGCGVTITQVALPEAATIIKGETLQLEVNYGTEKETTDEKIAEAAAKLTLVWESSDENVVTVDETGLASALAAGEADITVSVQDTDLQAVCHVTVTVPLESIQAPEELELVINGEETKEMGAKLVPEDATGVMLTYESSDPEIATVDKNGIVTAVGNGECKIKTAVASTDTAGEPPKTLTSETKVTVKTAPTEIVLATTEGILTVGNTYHIKASVGPEDVSEELAILSWTTSDDSIATVDSDGNVKAVKAGTATITATAGEASAEYALTVQNITCSYCGQTGHTSSNCPKKAADQKAAQQAAAAAAAAQQTAGSGGATGGGSGGEVSVPAAPSEPDPAPNPEPDNSGSGGGYYDGPGQGASHGEGVVVTGGGNGDGSGAHGGINLDFLG